MCAYIYRLIYHPHKHTHTHIYKSTHSLRVLNQMSGFDRFLKLSFCPNWTLILCYNGLSFQSFNGVRGVNKYHQSPYAYGMRLITITCVLFTYNIFNAGWVWRAELIIVKTVICPSPINI